LNKWLSIGISGVLLVALVATGFLYFGKSSDLKTANTEIATQKTTIEGLNTDLAASKAETADFKGKLAASEANVVTLNGNITNLTGQNTKLTSDLTAANTLLSAAQTELSSTKSSLSSAQSALSTAQSTNSTLTANLKKVTDPRHFASVTELKDWLQKDDTNTKYPTLDVVQKAYILQIRALRDGFLLPVSLYYDSYGDWVANRAIIDGVVYSVIASTDNIYIYDTCTIQPSHPEALP
jgi:septal ring factor EnvC (AmiA/AmiB activator)